MIKLLATDFDNTLFKGNDYQENIIKINKFVDRGNLLIIATGRHINHLLADIKTKNLKYNYLVCNDGGIIFDQQLKIIYQKNIPQSLVKPIIDLYKNDPSISDWFIDAGTFTTNNINNPANGLIGKITDFKKAKLLLNIIETNYKEVHGYISERFINITEKNVTKGEAINVIKKLHQINNNQIYTIGDNINDISMSIYNSYCIKNSNPKLKTVCKGEYNSVYQLIDDLLIDKL